MFLFLFHPLFREFYSATSGLWDAVAEQPLLDRWLASQPLPLAVLALLRLSGRGRAEACNRVGLRVPQDVAIMGCFNDRFACEISEVPLSSVELFSEEAIARPRGDLHRLMSGRPGRQHARAAAAKGIVVAAVHRGGRDRGCQHQGCGAVHHRPRGGADFRHRHPAPRPDSRHLEMQFAMLNRTPGEEIKRAIFQYIQRLVVDTDWSVKAIA